MPSQNQVPNNLFQQNHTVSSSNPNFLKKIRNKTEKYYAWSSQSRYDHQHQAVSKIMMIFIKKNWEPRGIAIWRKNKSSERDLDNTSGMAKTMTGNIIGKHQVLSRRRYSIAFLYSHFHLLLLQKKLIKMETNCCLGFGNLSQQSKLMAGVIRSDQKRTFAF
jgi:hypothetical protein